MTDAEFEVLWESCFPKLVRYCRFRTANVDDAKEIAAEAFTRLFAQNPAPDSALPWLYRVASNLSVDRGRKTTREAAFVRQSRSNPNEATWRDPSVWDAVRSLPRDQRLAVYLRMIENLTFPEMGSVLGRSEAAAKMLYHRAINRLGQLMGVESDG